MTDEEIKEVTKPLKSVYMMLDYSEAVVIGSVVGQLISEIKRLRDKKIQNLRGGMLELILKGSSEDELHCEITDVLDDYLLEGYKKHSWLRSYLCKYDDKTLCIRVPGATRGNIKLEKNVIKEINLYDDTAFSEGLGCYDKKKKNELIEKLNKFIGCSFK